MYLGGMAGASFPVCLSGAKGSHTNSGSFFPPQFLFLLPLVPDRLICHTATILLDAPFSLFSLLPSLPTVTLFYCTLLPCTVTGI